MRSLQITLAAAAAAAIFTTTTVTAQSMASYCTCSPTSYNFRLNFDGTCDSTTGFQNDSVEGSLCFFTDGSDGLGDTIDFGVPPSNRLLRAAHGEVEGEHQLQQQQQWKRILGDLDLSSHFHHAETIAKQQEQQQQKPRRAQASDTTPTVITSVTFLEADTTPELTIINQDSTYFDTSSSDGAILSYTSISDSLNPSLPLNDQMDLVPGGVMLVLFGVVGNEVVQNTVAWGYNTEECNVESLNVGDRIGWIVLGQYEMPNAEFCPVVTPSPTVGPMREPTPQPQPVAEPTPQPQPVVDPGSKASKSKGSDGKSGKSAKSVMDAKADKVHDVKSGKSAKSVMDAKADKVHAKAEKEPKGSEGMDPKAESKATKVFKEKSKTQSEKDPSEKMEGKSGKSLKVKSKDPSEKMEGKSGKYMKGGDDVNLPVGSTVGSEGVSTGTISSTIDTNTIVTPVPNLFTTADASQGSTLVTPAPSPFTTADTTEGSTPTVSTEVTGPPTKAGRDAKEMR